MIVGRHLRVSGRVQGVFFRQWTVEQAREIVVSGWVRNCPDGTVEAHVAGEEQRVLDLIERMRRGPPGAHVAQLSSENTVPEESRSFEIRRD
jgi:acylphosphatase